MRRRATAKSKLRKRASAPRHVTPKPDAEVTLCRSLGAFGHQTVPSTFPYAKGVWLFGQKQEDIPMKVMIAALALSVLAIGVAPAQIQLRIAAETAAPSKTPQSETTGGDKRNPEPHIYKLGEHLSEA